MYMYVVWEVDSAFHVALSSLVSEYCDDYIIIIISTIGIFSLFDTFSSSQLFKSYCNYCYPSPQ